MATQPEILALFWVAIDFIVAEALFVAVTIQAVSSKSIGVRLQLHIPTLTAKISSQVFGSILGAPNSSNSGT
jgi:hypothetical protein